MHDDNSIFITIVMPTYNAQHYIVNSIKSILIQNSNNYQLIIVDDHSTDKTVEIIKSNFKLEIEQKKIRLLVLEKNSGPSVARQTGLDNVDTPYVTFIDADDSYVTNDVIARLTTAIRKYEPDCIMYKYITDHGRFKFKKKYKLPVYRLLSAREAFVYKITKSNPIWHYLWNKCYKMDTIRSQNIRFDAILRMAEDVKFNESFLLNSRNLLFLNEYLYLYNCTNINSVSKKNSDCYNITIENSWQQYIWACNEFDTLCQNAIELNCTAQCYKTLHQNLCFSTAKIMLKAKRFSWYGELKYRIHTSSHFKEIASIYWYVYIKCVLSDYNHIIRLYIKKMFKH